MNINFSPEADADLAAIFEFIAKDNPRAADRTIARILQAISILETFPLVGRIGLVPETRELPMAGLSHIAVYRIVDETEIEIIGIVHGRQQYPKS